MTKLFSTFLYLRQRKSRYLGSVANLSLCRNNSIKIILKNLPKAQNPLTFASWLVHTCISLVRVSFRFILFVLVSYWFSYWTVSARSDAGTNFFVTSLFLPLVLYGFLLLAFKSSLHLLNTLFGRQVFWHNPTLQKNTTDGRVILDMLLSYCRFVP